MGKIEEKLKDRLFRLREAADHSQASLAAEVGVSTQTIKDIEAGRTDGGLKSLRALSKYFGITVEELVGKTDPNIAVKKERPFKVNKVASYLTSVPDEVYALALKLSDPEHEVWGKVVGLLEDEVRELKAQKAKQG